MGKAASERKQMMRLEIGRASMRRSMKSFNADPNTQRQGLRETKCGKCGKEAIVPGEAKRHRKCGGRWR